MNFNKLRRMKEFYEAVIAPVYSDEDYFKDLQKNLGVIAPKKTFLDSIPSLSETIESMVGDVIDINYIPYNNTKFWCRKSKDCIIINMYLT
jgi:hypothetical protein